MIITRNLRKVTAGMGCIAILSATAAGTPAAAQSADATIVEGPGVTWLVSLWGNRRGFSEGVEAMAGHLSERTGGNFQLSLQYGEVLSAPRDNLDGLQFGAFEVAAFCPTYHPDKTPGLTGLDLPFLPISGYDNLAHVVESYLAHPAIVGEFARWNTVSLLGIPLSPYEAMGRGKPPTELADWQGMRVSAPAGLSGMLRQVGAAPAMIAATDMSQSLERGVLDAVWFPYTYAHAAYGLHELSDWVTDDWALSTTICHLAVNKGAYDALPQQYRELLDEAKPLAYAHQFSEYDKVDIVNEERFAAENLVRVPMTDEIRTALEAAAQPAWEEWVETTSARGLPGQELLDFLLQSAAETH